MITSWSHHGHHHHHLLLHHHHQHHHRHHRQVHLLLPARPWDSAFFHFSSRFTALLAPEKRHALTFSPPLVLAVPGSNLPLLCPTLSISTCHSCSSSALTAFSGCTLTAMHLASTNLSPFCSISKVLHTPASTQTNFYTDTLLHQALFAETHFYNNQILHKPVFTQTRFSTNRLLHQPACTNQLLHK